MVDERGEATIRVDLGVFRPLVLACVDVDWDDVILEPKLFQDYSDFPMVLVNTQCTFYGAEYSLHSHWVRAPDLAIERELFA